HDGVQSPDGAPLARREGPAPRGVARVDHADPQVVAEPPVAQPVVEDERGRPGLDEAPRRLAPVATGGDEVPVAGVQRALVTQRPPPLPLERRADAAALPPHAVHEDPDAVAAL